MSLRLDEVMSAGLGDYRLKSMSWLRGGLDVRIDLLQPTSEDGGIFLLCSWATGIQVRLEFDEHAGYPLVWSSVVQRDERSSCYRVRLDFAGAPTGFVDVVCRLVEVGARSDLRT